jgi:ABC-type transport system involved in cytochrome c biogenesis ATPase subunit
MHPPPRLFGRTGELEILEQLIANARRGRSAVLVVRGEPGIGKTELLRQLTAEATGFAVARTCWTRSPAATWGMSAPPKRQPNRR